MEFFHQKEILSTVSFDGILPPETNFIHGVIWCKYICIYTVLLHKIEYFIILGILLYNMPPVSINKSLLAFVLNIGLFSVLIFHLFFGGPLSSWGYKTKINIDNNCYKSE